MGFRRVSAFLARVFGVVLRFRDGTRIAFDTVNLRLYVNLSQAATSIHDFCDVMLKQKDIVRKDLVAFVWWGFPNGMMISGNKETST